MPTHARPAIASGLQAATRRRRRGDLGALLSMLLPGCAPPATPPPTLQAEPTSAGLEVVVRGADYQQATLVLNRPWSGEQALFAGFVGLRCDPVVRPADRARGAGVQGGGPMMDGRAAFVIPAATVASIRTPAVLQALVTGTRADGSFVSALSPGLVLERHDAVRIRPCTAGWLLSRRAGALVALLLALPVLAMLFRLRWVPPPNAWRAALAGVVVLGLLTRAPLARTSSVEAGDAPPPLFCRAVADDRAALLERHYGPGVRVLLEAIAHARRPGEPLWIAMGTDRPNGREFLAAQLAHLLPAVRVTDAPPQSADPSLVLHMLVDAETRARNAQRVQGTLGAVPAAPEPRRSGQELARSAVGVLMRADRSR
ncbi:MAG: hypothetical protein AB7O97_16845 [Planctomycetota bacterium]